MWAFSRIPSTGGGSAGQGYVAGQSNRLTSATYFDANGVMRVAPPKALRPNYVYKNGVWVRDGWLREGAASNQNNNANATWSGASINDESCTQYMDTFNRYGITCSLQPKGANGNPIQIAGTYTYLLNSIFVWCNDFTLIKIGPNWSSEFPFIQLGPKLRRYYNNGYFQPLYMNQTDKPLLIHAFGMMGENKNSYGVPTSWIPYNTNRDAD